MTPYTSQKFYIVYWDKDTSGLVRMGVAAKTFNNEVYDDSGVAGARVTALQDLMRESPSNSQLLLYQYARLCCRTCEDAHFIQTLMMHTDNIGVLFGFAYLVCQM